MANPPISGKTQAQPSATSPREQVQDAFRNCLRQADRLIKEENFAEARRQIEEAKKLDPSNPFIIAFEERLRLFETQKDKPLYSKTAPPPSSSQQPIPSETPPAEQQGEASDADHHLMEQRLRQTIEAEYKARFTNELRKAEEQISKALDEERARMELQREAFKSKHDHLLYEAQQRLEHEYREKLGGELARAEQRLQEQFSSKIALTEQEMRAKLSLEYESEKRQLAEQLKREHDELVEKERRSFEEREKAIEAQFHDRLKDTKQQAETLLRQESVEQQREREEHIRSELTAKFSASLQKEREDIQTQYESMKKELHESFEAEQKKLLEEHQQQVQEQTELLRRQEAEEAERQRKQQRHEIEEELRAQFHERITAERQRIQGEADHMIVEEKKRLQEEHESFLRQQNANVQNARTTIQKEMDQNFLKRMEQIAKEYDHKMELLGTKVPETTEGRTQLYRERMRMCYVDGQPSVEDAKRLMELKELLELTFDEHLLIESDVRLDLYVESVERKIISGEVNMSKLQSLEELKQQFRISPDESARLEPYILSIVQRLAVKGRILVADDDLLLLQTLDQLLVDNGYQVIPETNVNDALEYLGTTSVDLILSDIKFDESSLDGFQFYLSVQSQPQLRSIPFIFMSSLRDGVIIRSGVQLGVDDYLTKPIDPDLLMAVIEGKIKRYRSVMRK